MISRPYSTAGEYRHLQSATRSLGFDTSIFQDLRHFYPSTTSAENTGEIRRYFYRVYQAWRGVFRIVSGNMPLSAILKNLLRKNLPPPIQRQGLTKEARENAEKLYEQRVAFWSMIRGLPNEQIPHHANAVIRYLIVFDHSLRILKAIAKIIARSSGDPSLQNEIASICAFKYQLAAKNLGLARYTAKVYRTKIYAFEDAVQEAFFGLIRAVESFDTRRRLSFSTYARQWIRFAIQRGRATYDLIYCPSRASRMAAYLKEAEVLRQRIFADGEKDASVYTSFDALFKKIALLEKTASALSLDYNPLEEEGTNLGALLADSRTIQSSGKLARLELCEHILARVAKLPERLRRIVTFRYGLNDESPHTLEETALRLEPLEGKLVTPERIRQLETRAFEALARDPVIHTFLSPMQLQGHLEAMAAASQKKEHSATQPSGKVQ